jgi:hypothetical protein
MVRFACGRVGQAIRTVAVRAFTVEEIGSRVLSEQSCSGQSRRAG